MRSIVLFTIFISFQSVVFSSVIKVPGDYQTIQKAIDAAVAGDTVLVSPGTYCENISFKGKGITVISEQGADVTTLDGNQYRNVVTFQSGEGLDSILDGFKITNGFKYYGGGISCDNSSSPTIRNNHILGNNGHGIYCDNSSSPNISDNRISGNSQIGIRCRDTSSLIIVNNTISGHRYSGIWCVSSSAQTITNNTVSGNSHGIVCDGTSFSIIRDNTIYENSEVGIYCSGTLFSIVTNNTISRNGDKGIFDDYSSSSTITNNIISENSNCGIYCRNDDPNIPTITNNTVTGHNHCGIHEHTQSRLIIKNTIVWNNSKGIYVYPGNPGPIIRYSDIQGGWPGKGNIDADPLFVEEANGDFHLTFSSPCKDTGKNSHVVDTDDFEGDPRIAYGTVDMGADEFYTHLYWTGDATPGGNVEVKFVGLPGISPVGLCIGTGVLDPPIPSMWGDWYLKFPIIGPVDLGSITSPEGVLIVPGVIPATPPPPYSIPMQALIGAELSNLSVLEIK